MFEHPRSAARTSPVRRLRLALVLVVAAAAASAAGCAEKKAKTAVNPYPDTAALKKGLEAGKAIVVDVRTLGEFNGGHIPTAKHIPLSEIEKRYAELPKDKDLVLYCAVGARSGAAIEILRRHGYTRLYNFIGLSHWKGPIERPH